MLRAAPPVRLEGKSLRNVVDHVAREKGLTVRYDVKPSDAPLHGDVALSLDEALDAAVRASALTEHTEGDTLVIGSAR
jgi:hypothetical protein